MGYYVPLIQLYHNIQYTPLYSKKHTHQHSPVFEPVSLTFILKDFATRANSCEPNIPHKLLM